MKLRHVLWTLASVAIFGGLLLTLLGGNLLGFMLVLVLAAVLQVVDTLYYDYLDQTFSDAFHHAEAAHWDELREIVDREDAASGSRTDESESDAEPVNPPRGRDESPRTTP
jgi:hypothetical protein